MDAAIKASNSPAHRHKKANYGAKHPNFKKDRSIVKHRLRPESTAWREEVFKRDGHKCVKCGATNKLVADHIKPYEHFPELRYRTSNGQTVCTPCHRKTTTYGMTKKVFQREGVAKEIYKKYFFSKRKYGLCKKIADEYNVDHLWVCKIMRGDLNYAIC